MIFSEFNKESLTRKFSLMTKRVKKKLIGFISLLSLHRHSKLYFSLGHIPYNLMVIPLDNPEDENLALVKTNRGRMEYSEARDKFSQELNNESTPFAEAFPNYLPSIDIIPVKIFKYINNSMNDNMSDLFCKTINKVGSSGAFYLFINNLKDKDFILPLYKKVPAELINKISLSRTVFNGAKPLGTFGYQT